MGRKLERYGIVDLVILSELNNDTKNKSEKYQILFGASVKMHSQRYAVFQKNLTCVCCGIEGEYFAIEKAPESKHYHLNLYAIDEQGNEVLMTKDHIVPKSKGGRDFIENFQTMCEHCNREKGSSDANDLRYRLEQTQKQIRKKLKEARYIKKQLALLT